MLGSLSENAGLTCSARVRIESRFRRLFQGDRRTRYGCAGVFGYSTIDLVAGAEIPPATQPRAGGGCLDQE